MTKKQKIWIVIKIFLAVLAIVFTFVEIQGIVHYVDNITNGYHPITFTGVSTGKHYYGWEAFKEDTIAHLLYGPSISIASFFQSIWMFILFRKKSTMACLVVSVVLFELNLFYWILIL